MTLGLGVLTACQADDAANCGYARANARRWNPEGIPASPSPAPAPPPGWTWVWLYPAAGNGVMASPEGTQPLVVEGGAEPRASAGDGSCACGQQEMSCTQVKKLYSADGKLAAYATPLPPATSGCRSPQTVLH
ncbi:hypothetical protein [Chondromyces apiculatus]|nr:hypothetical protein [Chondromyces apiculatus]